MTLMMRIVPTSVLVGDVSLTDIGMTPRYREYLYARALRALAYLFITPLLS